MSSANYLNFIKRAKFNLKWAHVYYKAYNKIANSSLFDEKFYTEAYPKVAKSGMDPLEHYLFYGFKEGRLPSLYFDGDYYLRRYPNVLESGMNPLAHYILYGIKEGKKSRLSPVLARHNEITETNRLFLNNYDFDDYVYLNSETNEELKGEPLVSIVILNLNGFKHLKLLFEDFDKKTNYSNYEIIVVDNGSNDESVSYLNELSNSLPITIIENNENKSFSKANNEAVAISNGEYILLLNNDIEPTFGWLNEMVGTIVFNDSDNSKSNLDNNGEIAAVGAKLVFPNYYDLESKAKSFTIQHTGDMFAERMEPCCAYAYNRHNMQFEIFDADINYNEDCIAVTAAVMLIRKSIYKELRGLDEDYNYGLEDVDLALRLNKAGFRIALASHALLFHHESSTRSHDRYYVEKDAQNVNTLATKQGKYLSKNMLLDKLANRNFFTLKSLDFTFVSKDLNLNSDNFDFISGLAKSLNSKDYCVDLISDSDDYYCGDSIDILISFYKDYKIANIKARKDILKIMIVEDFDSNKIEDITSIDNLKSYDLIISLDENVFNQLSLKLANDFDINKKLVNIPFNFNGDCDSFSDELIENIQIFVENSFIQD